MVAGSAVLFWFSSSAAVRLDRTPSGAVNGTFERRLFGLIPHSRSELTGILSVRLERGQANLSDSRSRMPDRLAFDTETGSVDHQQVQNMFVRDATVLSEFLADRSRPELSLSSTGRTREKLRFAFAQLVGALLALGGAGLATTGIRGLLGKEDSLAG
jgi:hypothetical protein